MNINQNLLTLHNYIPYSRVIRHIRLYLPEKDYERLTASGAPNNEVRFKRGDKTLMIIIMAWCALFRVGYVTLLFYNYVMSAS